MIEAEFHTIWKSPEGNFVDITPKPVYFDSILFLPDPKKEYGGRQINNIRKPLINSLLVRRFIDIHNRIFAELNKGNLANYHGEIEPNQKLIKLHDQASRLQESITEKYGNPY